MASESTNTTTPDVPEWARKTIDALLDASRYGRGNGRLTVGEQHLLDYLFLSVKERAGLLDEQPSDHLDWDTVISATWDLAVQEIEASDR
jgi:hypothetical protein